MLCCRMLEGCCGHRRDEGKQMSALRIVFALIFVALASGQTVAQGAPPGMPGTDQPLLTDAYRIQPVFAAHGMVAAQEHIAARIGADILRQGGNAVDAAVAVGFAEAVTLPRAGNLGGGGFMLVYLADRKETVAIDYRETAPAAATATMFLDAKGDPDPKKSRDSGLSVGIPGTVAGLVLAHQRYGSGKLSLADLITPAVLLAHNGIVVNDDLAEALPAAASRLGRFSSTRQVFFNGDRPYQRGERLVQQDLADTLSEIADGGADAFYKGRIAEQIAAAVSAAGGIMTVQDLADYKAIVREPVRGSYRDYEIASMPPPSSGGVHLIEILNILERFDMAGAGAQSALQLHLMTEAMRQAYADRASFLGDPDRVKVPVSGLTSKTYAEAMAKLIDPLKARKSSEVKAGDPLPHEGDQTTHFSVVDKDGNAVANTYTLNFSYGFGLVAEGTGILLNNEMDDFSAKPGAQNAYGLVGSNANSVAPGARPLSSMSPTFLFKDGKLAMVTGSPGGSRIISTVLNVIVNVIDNQMSIAEAVAAPRPHHQWQPDVLLVEEGFSPDTLQLLRERGHKVVVGTPSGSANSILVTPEGLFGAADTRQRGTLAVGY